MPVLQTLRSCWRNAADESTWVNTGICTRLTCSRSALQLHKNRRTATDKGHTHTHTHMHVRASCIPDGCHLARCSRDLHLNRCFGVTEWSLIIQRDTGAGHSSRTKFRKYFIFVDSYPSIERVVPNASAEPPSELRNPKAGASQPSESRNQFFNHSKCPLEQKQMGRRIGE